MTETKKWKRFEELVAHVQRSLAPSALVTQNERVRGHDSEVMREIDISIRQSVGQYDLFIAMDCKDYKRPVDVKDVEAFIGLVKDVRANKGAMVAANGFTEAARALARVSGIDLYRLIDAEQHEWQTYVSMPHLVTIISIESYNLLFRSIPEFRQEMPKDTRDLILYDNRGEPIGNISSLINKLWDSGRIPYEPGEYKDIPIAEIPTYVAFKGNYMGIVIKANIRVVSRTYYGQVPMESIKGFSDEINDELITTSMDSAPIILTDVMQNWTLIESRSLLAIKPVMELTFLQHYDE